MPLQQGEPFLVVGALAFDTPVLISGPVRGAGRLIGRAQAQRLGGGGANAACALIQAGHRAALVAVVADSDDGRARLAAAAALGIDTELIATVPGPDVTTLLLIDAAGERTVLLIAPEGGGWPPAIPPLNTPAALAIAARARGVYLRAPYPGGAALGAACAGSVVSHWPGQPDQLACAGVLIGSADDLGQDVVADPRTAAIAQGARADAGLVITDGAGSVRVITAEGEALRITPPAVARVVDTTGAGDVFAAGVLEALAGGADLGQAVVHGCAWGALAVSQEGSVPRTITLPAFRAQGA